MISSISQPSYSTHSQESYAPENLSIGRKEIGKDKIPLSPLYDLPILPPPREPIALSILRAQNAQSDAIDRDIQENYSRIDDEQKRKQTFHQEKVKAIKEAMEKQSSLGTWEMATKVISCIGAVFTIGLGAITLATGGAAVAGVALMVAGGLLLANQIATEVRAWEKLAKVLSKGDEELEQNILWHLTTWITLATLVLSIGTSIFGNFSDQANNVALFGRVVQGTLAVATGITSIGRGVIDYGRRNAQAESKRLEAKISTSEFNLKTLAQANEALLRRSKEIAEFMKKYLRTEAEIHKQILKRY